MKLYSITENECKDILVDAGKLEFYELCDNVRTVSFWQNKTDTSKITILQIDNLGSIIEFAVMDFAGITQDEEDIAIHLCRDEEIESVTKTIRVNKSDNMISVEELQSLPYVKSYDYLKLGGNIEYQYLIVESDQDE